MGRIPLTDAPPEVESQPVSKIETPASTPVKDDIEVPYTDYTQQHGHPYLVDHFQLGDSWDDNEGGFPNEIATIESYIQKKIKSGEVANSVTAIRSLIRGLEKINNLNKEERAVVNLEVLSNYVEFLMKNDKLKANLRRYNGAR